MIYLSTISAGTLIYMEITADGWDSPQTATLYYQQKNPAEYAERDAVGAGDIVHADGFYSRIGDLKYALPYTDAEVDMEPDYVLGVASRISILDDTYSEAFTLKPFNESILTPVGTSYSFDFEGVPTAENLATEGCILPEWKLIIKELQSYPSLSFPNYVSWANGITPNFDNSNTIEFSFIPIVYGGQHVYLLGTWTSYAV